MALVVVAVRAVAFRAAVEASDEALAVVFEALGLRTIASQLHVFRLYFQS